MKFDEVTRQGLHACYHHLAHNEAKKRLENILIKQQQNRSR